MRLNLDFLDITYLSNPVFITRHGAIYVNSGEVNKDRNGLWFTNTIMTNIRLVG